MEHPPRALGSCTISLQQNEEQDMHLYNLDIKRLSDMICKHFSHSVGYLLILDSVL